VWCTGYRRLYVREGVFDIDAYTTFWARQVCSEMPNGVGIKAAVCCADVSTDVECVASVLGLKRLV
jgi:hypothetical protein